ncbi:serine hydrolase [Nocardia thailandica]|uniref:serine hydrolase n=1 Tax=Nocardia thailandica TaxID=257275 RepID=UPI0005B9FD36|nr:serine hydrolase [Nocardia thailandica]
MVPRPGRLTIAVITAFALVTACGDDSPDSTAPPSTASAASAASAPPNEAAGVPLPDDAVADAVGQLDGLVRSLMDQTHIPGMAVAVVHDGKPVYAKGFGVRRAGGDEKVDTGTVFQLASVSKSLAATVVAHEVGAGTVGWETPVVQKLPSFALADPYVTANVTIGDLFSHRSGLPEHAGDRLEDLGYDRAQVLDKLRQEPLDPFRISYHYTNFGLTAAAEAVATAAGVPWETLSEQVLYGPLGMTSTSSRFADFESRADRAEPHVLVDGRWEPRYVRDADAQSPAGGASSSIDDMARWLALMLDGGRFPGGVIAPEEALTPAITTQVISNPAQAPTARSGGYGFGFNVSSSSAGRTAYSHSGAFTLGAATTFHVIPSANVGIVVLTNAAPIGVPEILAAEFADLVQFGSIQQDWRALFKPVFASLSAPEGELVGKQPPANPAPAQPLPAYAGTYANNYWGPATITEEGGALVLVLGPKGMRYPLRHWDGDTFVFDLQSENAPPGTISRADFAGNTVRLEYFDQNGLGTFTR